MSLLFSLLISSLLNFCSNLALDTKRTAESSCSVSHGASLRSTSSRVSSSVSSILDSPQCYISPWPHSWASKLEYRGRNNRGCNRGFRTCWGSLRSCRQDRAHSTLHTCRHCSLRSSYTDLASNQRTFLDFSFLKMYYSRLQHTTLNYESRNNKLFMSSRTLLFKSDFSNVFTWLSVL